LPEPRKRLLSATQRDQRRVEESGNVCGVPESEDTLREFKKEYDMLYKIADELGVVGKE